jgi:hypothetical protein
MKLYTLVVHYLQMCMKEYGCCPKFKRGDNSTYTFTKRGGGGMYLVRATPTKLLQTLFAGGIARYDNNLTIMKSPKPATDNKFK